MLWKPVGKPIAKRSTSRPSRLRKRTKGLPPMSDDVFRIVITVAVILACLAFLVQAGVAIALYRVARKMQEKISPLVEKGEQVADKAGPVIERIGPLLDQARPVVQKAGPAVDRVTEILATSGKILEDTRPRIAEIAAD